MIVFAGMIANRVPALECDWNDSYIVSFESLDLGSYKTSCDYKNVPGHSDDYVLLFHYAEEFLDVFSYDLFLALRIKHLKDVSYWSCGCV